jgi:Protein of unknown function (DUF2796)
MQKFHLITVAAAVVVASASALAAEEHRELGPHEHGHGRLNIAIEGKRVSMELQAPGADIVGFEHEASTPEQKAALAKAKATLADALSVFRLPEGAGCKVANASVAIQAEDAHEHEHDAANKEADEHGEHHHSEFHVQYALDCATPNKLTNIEFKYFDLFAGAQELDINLVTDKAQNHYEVKRGQPKLDLGEIG